MPQLDGVSVSDQGQAPDQIMPAGGGGGITLSASNPELAVHVPAVNSTEPVSLRKFTVPAPLVSRKRPKGKHASACALSGDGTWA
jgi:hypothetical protein